MTFWSSCANAAPLRTASGVDRRNLVASEPLQCACRACVLYRPTCLAAEPFSSVRVPESLILPSCNESRQFSGDVPILDVTIRQFEFAQFASRRVRAAGPSIQVHIRVRCSDQRLQDISPLSSVGHLMCAHKPEIIVAGGGVAGAAVALFLSRLDVNVLVLEGRPCRPTHAEGGMLMLGPNGMHVLNGLGLVRALLQRDSGVEVPWITITDSAGGHISRVPQGSEKRYGFASTMVMRSDLHDVLLDEVEKRQLDINWGAQVNSIEESDDGILVRWIQNGQTQEKKVNLLIGADGIWSMVRSSMYQCLGLSAPKMEYSGLVGIGSLVNIDSVPGLSGFLSPDRPCVMIHGRQGFVGMGIFDKENKKVGWWTTHEAPNRTREEWKVPKEQALVEIRQRYSGWAFPVPQLIAAAEASNDELFVWPVFQVRKLEHWHSRRSVLIGDAAHAMPPHSGQGASQALEDAGYLAYLLRKQSESAASETHELDWTSTLAKFQSDRQPRVDGIVKVANQRGDQKRDMSVLAYLIKRWIMWIVFLFMRESWLDAWFGYKVPGIDEW